MKSLPLQKGSLPYQLSHFFKCCDWMHGCYCVWPWLTELAVLYHFTLSRSTVFKVSIKQTHSYHCQKVRKLSTHKKTQIKTSHLHMCTTHTDTYTMVNTTVHNMHVPQSPVLPSHQGQLWPSQYPHSSSPPRCESQAQPDPLKTKRKCLQFQNSHPVQSNNNTFFCFFSSSTFLTVSNFN